MAVGNYAAELIDKQEILTLTGVEFLYLQDPADGRVKKVKVETLPGGGGGGGYYPTRILYFDSDPTKAHVGAVYADLQALVDYAFAQGGVEAGDRPERFSQYWDKRVFCPRLGGR